MLMDHTYNIPRPNHPVNIVFHTYLRCYHNPNFVSHRLYLQQRYYYTLLRLQILGQTDVEFPVALGMPHIEITTQSPPLGDVRDWSLVPYVHIFYIKTDISWLLLLKP